MRLSYLVELGLLRRNRYQTKPVREEYRLTPLGKDIYGNVLASWLWDRRWGDPHRLMPPRLVHRPCGHACMPLLLCKYCSEPLATCALGQRQPGAASDRAQPPLAQPPNGR